MDSVTRTTSRIALTSWTLTIWIPFMTAEATHAAVVCEDLTLPGERIRRLPAREIASCGASSLAIVLLIRRTLLP